MKLQKQLKDNEFLTVLPLGAHGNDVQVLVQYRPAPKGLTHNCIGHPIAVELTQPMYTAIREIISGQEHDFEALPPNLQEQISKHRQPSLDIN